MIIDIHKDDLLHLRDQIENRHNDIDNYKVLEVDLPEWKGTQDGLREDQRILRKFYRKLTKAIEKAYGHDCHASAKMQLP